MKKFYLLIFTIISFLGISSVNAISTEQYASRFWNNYSTLVDVSDNYSSTINNMISYYNNNLSSDYAYYIIFINTDPVGSPDINLVATNASKLGYHTNSAGISRWDILDGGNHSTYKCDYSGSSCSLYDYFTASSEMPYSSNTDFSLSRPNVLPEEYATKVIIPSFSDLDLDVSYPQMVLNINDLIPTYQSLTDSSSPAGFVEIDMSQYEYIILSLLNYDTQPFNTTIYSLGRLCFTPVYDYGMKSKSDYFNGYKTAGCTEYYNTTTPVPIYIIQNDLTNHAVYYIKRYEDESNIIRVPQSIFNITYVTSSNANNPSVIIDGRSYPAIPYSELTDSANISTEQGYISGQTCALGDVNCYYRDAGIDISDLFTNPLKLLKTVWGSISTMFVLISSFIALLPPTLQAFTFSAFMLSIVLGVIKMIL